MEFYTCITSDQIILSKLYKYPGNMIANNEKYIYFTTAMLLFHLNACIFLMNTKGTSI